MIKKENPLLDVINGLISEGHSQEEIEKIIHFFSLGAANQELIREAIEYLKKSME